MYCAKAWFPSIALLSVLPLPGFAERKFTITADVASRPKGTMIARTARFQPLVPIAFCLLAMLSAGVALAADPPAELHHLGFARDKNWNEHTFWMKLSNKSDKPQWVVLPWGGNEPLPEKTLFRNEKVVFEQPLNMMFFDAKGGMVAIGVSCGINFRAFRLPARTVLEIPEYNMATHRSLTTDFTQIDVVEADELLVNGKVPLEKWLPFNVGVFKEEKLPSGVGKKAKLESEKAAAARKERQGEKVEYIEAKGVHRWTVSFENKGEKP